MSLQKTSLEVFLLYSFLTTGRSIIRFRISLHFPAFLKILAGYESAYRLFICVTISSNSASMYFNLMPTSTNLNINPINFEDPPKITPILMRIIEWMRTPLSLP